MSKRKNIFRILLSLGLALIVILAAGIAVLRSSGFHRYVLAKMIEKASEATGMRVEIGDFHFHFSGLKVDVDRIVVHGTESASAQPLLQVDHVRVGLKIISLLRRQVDLSEIVIDHPVIFANVGKNGASNWATAPKRAEGSSTVNVFDLAIGHFVVNNGEVNYHNRQIPLAAELNDFDAAIDFSSHPQAYSGSLGYRDGLLQFGDFNPVRHSIQAKFSATPDGLALESVKLDAASSSLSAQATLKNYRNPTVNGTYQAEVSTGELGAILKAKPFPAGMVSVQGTGHYVYQANQPFLDALTLAGKFQSKALALDFPPARSSVRALRGDYQLSGGTLEARNVQGAILGGTVSGHITLAHLSQRIEVRAAATARNISLAAASNAFSATPLQAAAITGNLDGSAEATWQGSGDDLKLTSDSTITASAPVERQNTPQAGALAATAIPVQGVVHLAYDGPSGTMTLNHTQFATPHTTLSLDGTTGKQSSLSVQAHSDDLREVDQLSQIALRAVSTRPSPAQYPRFAVDGSASFTGELRGPAKNLHLAGDLASNNLQYQGTNFTELRTHIDLDPSNLSLSQSEIQTADHAQVQFNGAVGLSDWTYKPQNPIRVDLIATRVPAATIERLAHLAYPVTGTLAARVSLHGTQSNLAGQGSVTLTQAEVYKQPVQNLSVAFQAAGTAIHATVQVQAPAGSGSGKLTYDFRNQGYDAAFTVPTLQLEKFVALQQEKTQISGAISASLQGKGTFKNPQLDATLQAPRLVIDKQSLDGLKLQVNVAQQKATLSLVTSSQGASIQARGNINLDANYDATASLDVRNVQLGTLLTAYFPDAPSGLHGQAELHGTLRGPLKQWKQIEAQVEIPTLNLAYQSVQIGNASPLRANYRGGVFSLEQCAFKGTGTNLQIQGSVAPMRGGSITARAAGSIDLHILQMFYPDWATSGQVNLNVNAQGTVEQPNVRGTVQVINAVFQPPDAPLGVQKLNAAFALQNGRIDIQNFVGEAGGGTITAQGFATIQPKVQFNMRVAAKEVRLRYPVGTRTILGGTLLLTGSREAAVLSGRVLIDRVSLTKEFDVSTFADQFTGSAAETSPGIMQNIKLNVTVDSANDMAVANNKLSIQGSANLIVRGTLAEPVILGRTDITDGEIFFNGQRYKVDSGVVQFVNPIETEPVVNLHVTATVNQFDISMNFAGPVDRMRVTYTSDPPLAPVDIINLLATGQTTEASSANSSTPQSVIAGQLTSQFSNRVEKLAGISSLTIDPNVGTGQGTAGARLTVQQRVTKNLYFSLSTDLQNSADQTVQVEYQATKRFAVNATRDQNGGYTVQIKMHHRF